MDKSKEKLCIDCKYHHYFEQRWQTESHKCSYPAIIEYCLVTGNITTKAYRDCFTERTPQGGCTHLGNLFERKPV